MKTTIYTSKVGNDELRELARRTAYGLDVTLLWDSRADRVFVDVDDQRRGEHFRVPVGNGNPLDVYNHPYAYAGPMEPSPFEELG